MSSLVSLICLFIWLSGIIIAKGFISTFFAVLVPFWAYYLVVEKLLILSNII
jgi:hypothetical protein